MKIAWHTETRKLSDLKEWDRNPRLITEKGIADLTRSIDKFGLAEPIVINTDGLILGGHARYKVLKAKGETECACYVPDRQLTPEEVEEINIRLNANIAGTWDFETLANEWDEEKLTDWGLEIPEFKNDSASSEEKEKCTLCGK